MFVCHVGEPLCIRRKILVERHMGMDICANVASVYDALVLVGLLHAVGSSAIDSNSF